MERVCPTSCASKACPKGRDPTKEKALKVVGANFHAHLAGHEMYMARIRNGEKVDIASQPLWTYDDQPLFSTLTKGFDLRPGDILQTTCVFDTTKGIGAKGPLRFGLETIDEMCLNGIMTEHTTEDAKLMDGTSF